MVFLGLDITENLLKEDEITTFDSTCIRQKSNMSKSDSLYRFDNLEGFDRESLLNDMKEFSPKLDKLLDKIEELDKKDQRKYGKKFKHFIFSDLKSAAYGPKFISSGLIAKGYSLGYTSKQIRKKDDIEWGPLDFLSDSELEKTRGKNFYLLSSVAVYGNPISTKNKKHILSKFNQRPENINGDLARIIVMDSGFKEGIDLFDIKYIHIFEPSVNMADQKQVIGRGTRTCGQKGLDFHHSKGWPLYVFIYDLEFPKKYKSKFLNSDTAFELYMKSINIDARLMNFTSELEEATVYGSIDYELNQNIHRFTIGEEDSDDEDERLYGGLKKGGSGPKVMRSKKGNSKFQEMRDLVDTHFREFTWDHVKMENTCVTPDTKKGGVGQAISYTPTQDFIRNYFSPQAQVKGMLLFHSVGTGKTCSAIAAASKNFEPQGYTILWVTRTTLKNDIWKNMFSQICNESLRNRTDEIPADPKKQMGMLSKAWRIRPMSYKQFSNLVSKENSFYKRLVKENGEEDPLRKTLLIIDEAHKLYGGGDLSSIERPDMLALHKSLMHSYAVSGQDSVRLLLMTATPITENPMELIQLMNLCKPIGEQLPATFETFKNEYLDDNGRFTDRGRSQYLDDIAGHISYLNREKDARQFAQPIIKRVLVNITDESLVNKFDKGLTRSEIDTAIFDLKTKTTESMKELEGDVAEIDPSRFAKLLEVCNSTNLKESTCKKLVKRHIKELINDIKEYKQKIKDKIKEIKEETKTTRDFKKSEMEKIKANIERFPDQYEKYKKSPFFLLKNDCSKTIIKNDEVLEQVEGHPEIIKYNNDIKEHEQNIQQLKESLKIDSDAFKLKMRQLRELLKTDLNDLEKSTVELTIRNNKKIYNLNRKELSKKINENIEDNKKEIKKLNKTKKKNYKKLQKSLKKMVSQGYKEKKAKDKEERTLRKNLRKQGELEDEIKDEKIKEIVKKHEEILELDLEHAEEDEKNRLKEKEEEKEKKQRAKTDKKQEKQREKDRAKTQKKQEKLEKKKEKDRAKTEKKQDKQKEKDRAKTEKKLEKDRVKTEKKQEKDRAKTEKKQEKDRAKTEKKQEKKNKGKYFI